MHINERGVNGTPRQYLHELFMLIFIFGKHYTRLDNLSMENNEPHMSYIPSL